MKKLSDEQIGQILEAGYELRNLEYKSAFNWKEVGSMWIREKTIRAVFAMTNIRFGGQIVIGVKTETDHSITLEGLKTSQIESFDDMDNVKGIIDGFSFTHTNFDINWGEYKKKKFIVFNVQEFDEIPVICKKDGKTKGILTAYDIYARSKKAPYSSIKATDIELREMMHMAVDKEKIDLKSRGWIKKDEVLPEKFYKSQIKGLI